MRPLLAAPVALVLLTGCAGDPQAQLRRDAAAVIDAANSGDAGAVRERAAVLEQTVAELRADGTLQEGRAAELTALAQSLVGSADVIDEDLLRERQEAEAKRLEEERARLEAERQQLEEDRKADEEREKGKGKGKKDDDDEEDEGD